MMNHDLRSHLKKWTMHLLELNNEAKSFYIEHARKEGYVPDFYGKVKPFADRVKEAYDNWRPLALQFIQTEKPLYLHPVQVEQIEENLEAVAIKSFFSNTSFNVQMQTYESVTFTLNQVLRALEQN